MPADLALITGASRGIGRATAKMFAELGLMVLVTARSKRDLANLQSEIGDQGGACDYICADLSALADVNQIINQIKSSNKKVSVLVHSAGIAKVGKIESFSQEDWDKTLTTNLTAPFLLTQACLPYMKKNAHIFFINSVAGRQVFPEWAGYSVSKWGLRALAETLRLELAGSAKKVTSVFPSSVDTALHDKLPYHWDRSQMLKDTDVAKAIIMCYRQSATVQVKEIDIDNLADLF